MAAHKAVCINNQKQIGIARQLYATDNEGHLVPNVMMDELTHPFPDRIRNHRAKVNWQDTLCASYLDRNTKLFECPAETRRCWLWFALVRQDMIWMSWLKWRRNGAGAIQRIMTGGRLSPQDIFLVGDWTHRRGSLFFAASAVSSVVS